jgi:hypothetical protein
MTAVVPSESSSSFTSTPSDASYASHQSLLALAAHAASMHGGGVSHVTNGNVTPSKSLTPRYAALHCPLSGVAQSYLQQQRHQQRREPRPRFVEGGAPSEKYLEPLPQHVHLPPHHQVYQQHAVGYGSTPHMGPMMAGSASNLLPAASGRSACCSPTFRQLPPCPASPLGTDCSSPGSLVNTLNQPLVCAGSHHHALSTQQLASSNSESCMSLHPMPLHLPGGAVSHINNAPMNAALCLDSVGSRGFPSPLGGSFNPTAASPQLPRPPSLSERTPNPRRAGGAISVSPQRPPPVRPPSQAGDDYTQQPTSNSDDDQTTLSHILGSYVVGGIQRVDSLVLARTMSSTLQQQPMSIGVTSVSPPQHICSFRQHDDDDVESGGSGTSPQHASSPFSSFRLDGSQWEVPSPRVGSSMFMDVLALRSSPQAQAVSSGGGGVGGPLENGSPVRTPVGSPRSGLLSCSQKQLMMSGYNNSSYSMAVGSGGSAVYHPIMMMGSSISESAPTVSVAAALMPPSQMFTDGRVRFTFQARDGGATTDSLEEDACLSGNQSPR